MIQFAKLKGIAFALVCIVLAGCAGKPREKAPWQPGGGWLSARGQEHPLAGRIWQVEEGRFVTPDKLAAALGAAQFVLLGEKHDNGDHHRIQSWLVARLLGRGRRPALVFEMFASDQAAALRRFAKSGSGNAGDIEALTQWQKSGWPSWSMYQPIAQSALDAGLPILAASPTRKQLRAMAMGGKSVFDAPTRKRLRLDTPLPADIAAAKEREVIASHCDMLPARMAGPMAATQTAKDAVMADVMLGAAAAGDLDGAILIAGSGHARADWGAPWHLARRAPDKAVISLGILETDDQTTDPAAYAARWSVDDLPFDFVWFTPRLDLDDPCAKYAKQLKKMGHGKRQPAK